MDERRAWKRGRFAPPSSSQRTMLFLQSMMAAAMVLRAPHDMATYTQPTGWTCKDAVSRRNSRGQGPLQATGQSAVPIGPPANDDDPGAIYPSYPQPRATTRVALAVPSPHEYAATYQPDAASRREDRGPVPVQPRATTRAALAVPPPHEHPATYQPDAASRREDRGPVPVQSRATTRVALAVPPPHEHSATYQPPAAWTIKHAAIRKEAARQGDGYLQPALPSHPVPSQPMPSQPMPSEPMPSQSVASPVAEWCARVARVTQAHVEAV